MQILFDLYNAEEQRIDDLSSSFFGACLGQTVSRPVSSSQDVLRRMRSRGVLLTSKKVEKNTCNKRTMGTSKASQLFDPGAPDTRHKPVETPSPSCLEYV